LCLPREDRRAEQLWLTLARELPEPERAEAATLVAVAAWMRGINALANVALDVAVTAQPGHPRRVSPNSVLTGDPARGYREDDHQCRKRRTRRSQIGLAVATSWATARRIPSIVKECHA
jgi:hypothetical protein